MPMVGCADKNNIELILCEHFSVIAVKFRHLSRLLTFAHEVSGCSEEIAINITQTYHIDRSHLDQAEKITLAVPTRSNQANFPGLLQIDHVKGIRTKRSK